MPSTTTTVFLSLATVCLWLYGWEYVAIRRSLEFSPSVALNSMAEYAVHFWKACGELAAWVSSFLTVFDFDDMLKAAERLWRPLWETATSWTYFFVGYVSEMNLYDHPYLVTMGSVLILAILGYLAYYFNLLKPVSDWFSQRMSGLDNPFQTTSNEVAYGQCTNRRKRRE